MAALVSIEELVTGYNGRPIVDSFSGEICSGDLICLIGRNGTGKSTLLRSLVGLHRPISGKVLVNGRDMTHLKPKEKARHVAFVSTERIRLGGLSTLQVVALGRYPHTGALGWTRPEDLDQARKCLEQLQIADLCDRPLPSLSDGEQQKVMLARALAQDAPFLVLDEPSAFLDYVAREELMVWLKNVVSSSERAILFSTHDVKLAETAATSTWKIESGRLEIKKH